jgi:hypothetical protein
MSPSALGTPRCTRTWRGCLRLSARLSRPPAGSSASTFGLLLWRLWSWIAHVLCSPAWLVDRVAVRRCSCDGTDHPGPVVIMATFPGYLVHGVLGAVVATLAVFVPVYLFVVVPGPLFRRYEDHPRLRGFMKGATAAAAGANRRRRESRSVARPSPGGSPSPSGSLRLRFSSRSASMHQTRRARGTALSASRRRPSL